MRVAVVGAGISGLAAAYTLAQAGVDVDLYEKEDYFGGHARTICVDGVDMDLGFMICNRVTYSNLMGFFEELGVDLELSDMSFSVSLDNGKGCEWSSSNGLSGLFAQKSNAFNPYFWQMIREIVKFKQDVLQYLKNLESDPSNNGNETLEEFIKLNGYSEKFRDAYLNPICASIWSCSFNMVKGFSAASVLSFCRNHHLLQIFGRPQWLTVKGCSHKYVNKVLEELERRGCKAKTNCFIENISTVEQGVLVTSNGIQEIYDHCIVGTHAPDALSLLGNSATSDERRVLGAFQYVYSNIYIHRDSDFMPRSPAAWSSWNFLGSSGNSVTLTYWLNKLQNLGDTGLPFLVTLNPPYPPKHTISTWYTSHPVPSTAAAQAKKELDLIQGKRGIWFCGAYQGYGFHEDGFKAGMLAAHCLLGESYITLQDTIQMSLSWHEIGARLIVTSFLQRYICTGCLCLLEDGGTVFQFKGSDKRCNKKSVLRIHRPSFYWKIATRADLGLADAYVDGDFSCADGEEGLLNMFLILIANRDLNQSVTKKKHRRGWWTPMLITAVYWSATSFLRHVSERNTLTQARRNISRHYDLSNDLFSLFLDETMTYSSAIFKGPHESLKDAQMRKIHSLIDKARIDASHELLEIGCGWGSLAIEVVKRTGCKYTGITLSEEQLKFAQKKVKEACLQDKITLLLCDYRELLEFHKFNRIISCEMLENVGHEFMEEFFGRCEYMLAEGGLLVLQFISIPDTRYDEYRRSSDFIKEYIFPGGCLPSLSRITSAMVAASGLCVEHVENIGIHYYQTLLLWRKNFQAHRRKASFPCHLNSTEKMIRQEYVVMWILNYLKNIYNCIACLYSEILKLGFNENFIRTWDYYFLYCAAGFKTLTLGDYQVVFSRAGNVEAFEDPYSPIPSAHCIDNL